ncbi:SDR family NAD(P)-dependent oxidoreductase [Acinetobacter sp. WU_MDCI_Abxc222]|uniref:SDR family NAD(P)-dependent oxidoreductase n=1 Tax=Acinetobacter sp. WU_MDCI_Abxc222 TaxID=2850076 RepID=UPI0021CDD0F7|nr:SDR family oxidoreductase [Acinetobacter sp. WU_MDCI_Abxc222]MCU4563769.1 SDR family oxidoreductase [Acinetobacter sp. WU_MDCI_Abxc222]
MDKLAVVVGSDGGIGKEIVYQLLDNDYKVIGLDLNNNIFLDNFEFYKIDIGDSKKLYQFDFENFNFGDYNVLINAAGIREILPLLDLDLTQWEEVISINLTAPFILSKNFCRKLVAEDKKGSIVNIASVSGMMGEPDRTAYVSSKHGLIGLTKQFAIEFGRKGIRCNSISPAITRTSMTEAYFQDEKILEKIKNGIYSTRVGEPKDIANVTLLLANKDSLFINGSNFVVDGGWTCGKDL